MVLQRMPNATSVLVGHLWVSCQRQGAAQEKSWCY